jgi:sensor histidine kinase YesM
MEVDFEVYVLAIISGFFVGGILGYFTAHGIRNSFIKSSKDETPGVWLERHKNLNSSLIQLRRRAEVKNEVVKARQKNLQLQMNPHFIFNALTGIHMLMLREDSVNSLRAIRKFKGLLVRNWGNAIDNPKAVRTNTLEEEVSFLSDYVELEQMRLSTEVTFTIEHSDILPKDYPIPTFLLQPLVENALWHGVSDEKESTIKIVFEASEAENTLKILVIDNGRGLDENHESNITGRANERKSYGLKILRERLRLISKESSFQVNNREDKDGCEAIITIPLEAGCI